MVGGGAIMADKTLISCRVYNLSVKFNLTQTLIHTIINTYIAYCRYRVIHGERVDFVNLVSLVPDVVCDGYRTTLAYECERVALLLKLPRNTVYAIIRAYLDDLVCEVLDGKSIEMRGLVTIKPLFSVERALIGVHSAISASIRQSLKEADTEVCSVRVHTSKVLRGTILKGGIG